MRMNEKTKQIYFAYGSNMSREQMSVRCPQAEVKGKIVLTQHRFIINPRGVASIVPDERSVVEGVLWELTPQCELSLDGYEGVSDRLYEKKYLHFISLPDPVLVYISTDQVGSRRPRPGYFEKILKAAHAEQLSPSYLQFLQDYYNHCEF